MKKLADIVASRADCVQRKQASFCTIASPKSRNSLDEIDQFQMLSGEMDKGFGKSWCSDQAL